jgi:hypothetical protein
VLSGGVRAAILCLRWSSVAGNRLGGVAGRVKLEVLRIVAWLLGLGVELGHAEEGLGVYDCVEGRREVMRALMKGGEWGMGEAMWFVSSS